jgi:putative membrane protein
MRYIIIRSIGILLASYITKVGIPLTLSLATGTSAVFVAIVLAVINHTIKPVIAIVSIPINVVTLGLFSFVINGFMIVLASRMVPGFVIPSLLVAIYFSVVLSIINWLLHIFE